MPRKKIDLTDFIAEAAEAIKEGSYAPNIKKYSPHEKQAKFHASQRKAKVYIGGNRSGKTTGGVTEAIWRSLGNHPYRPELRNLGPVRGRVVAVDITQGIEKIILPQYKQWCYPSALRGGTWETAYDKATRTLNFSNGSTIEFMSYDQDLEKFAGTSRHWVHFDEEPPKPIWEECLARLIDTDGDYWITMTPVEGMNWIYDDLYEPNVNNPDGKVEIIEINSIENPYLSGEAIVRFAEQVDGDAASTRVSGGYVVQGGLIYKNFDSRMGGQNVLSEPVDSPKAMFPERNWLWIMGLDHGLNNPTAVLWYAVDSNGFGVVFDEWYQKELTVDQHAAKIKSIIAKHGRFPDVLVADPSIVNRNGITNTSVQEEYQKYGLSFTPGNNNVKDGLIRVKKYFNPVKYVGTSRVRSPIVGGPPVGSTINEIDSWDVDKEALFPRVRITPNCQNLIWELKRYRWKTYTSKKLAYERNPYDEPNKKDDHACDALRYIIMQRPDLTAQDNSANGEKLSEAFRELDRKLSMTGDHDLADPFNVMDGGWNPEAAAYPSPGGSDWVTDEHMGGLL